MSHDLDPAPQNEWSDPFWLCRHPGAGPAVRTREYRYEFFTAADAKKFGDRVAQAGYPVEYADYAGDLERPWGVKVIATLGAQVKDKEFDASVDRIAALIGGRRQW